MKHPHLALFVLLCGCPQNAPAAPASPPAVSAPAPRQDPPQKPDWRPDLDPVIQQLEEDLDRVGQTGGQQDMNQASASLYFALDAKLYFLFEKWLAKLTPEKRKQAAHEQADWLEARRQKADKAGAKFQGGTGAPLARADMAIGITRKRIEEIEQRLGRTGK